MKQLRQEESADADEDSADNDSGSEEEATVSTETVKTKDTAHAGTYMVRTLAGLAAMAGVLFRRKRTGR
ncbi:MAG: hypothetical protein LUC83_10360 [Clostridiales bacterium]|nr:hypothetical protein [Clostridiales bacterium]